MAADDEGRRDQVRERIRRLVREVGELTESTREPGRYFPAFLQKVTAALVARGGAMWFPEPGGRWAPRFHVNIPNEMLHGIEPEGIGELHEAALSHVGEEGETLVLSPGQGLPDNADGPVNPSNFTLIFAPVLLDGRAVAALQVLQDADRHPQAYQGFAEFAGQMARQTASFLRQVRLRTLDEEQQVWSGLLQLQSKIHDSLDPARVAMNLANLGREALDADRLSVGLRVGRRVKVLAVSGQDTIDRHGHLTKGLAALGQAVCRDGRKLEFHADQEGEARRPRPQPVADALERFLAAGEARHVIALPLKRDERVVGILVAERVRDPAFSETADSHLELMAREGAVALDNAQSYRTIPFLGFMRVLRWAIGRGRVKLGIFLLVVATLVGVFGWVEDSLWLSGDATIVPVQQRTIYAPVDGRIVEVRVKHAQKVQTDARADGSADPPALESVLLVIQNDELTDALSKVETELAETRSQIEQLEAGSRGARDDGTTRGRLVQMQARFRGLELKRKSLQRQHRRCTVTSPIDGIVTTLEVQKLLGRPVTIGDPLLQVANTQGEWVVKVFLSEDRMGDVLQASTEAGQAPLPVRYYLAGHPERTFTGRVQHIGSAAEVIDDQNVVVVRVRPDPIDVPLKPDMGGRGKIYCGQHALGYVWFREVIQFVQTRFLF